MAIGGRIGGERLRAKFLDSNITTVFHFYTFFGIIITIIIIYYFNFVLEKIEIS